MHLQHLQMVSSCSKADNVLTRRDDYGVSVVIDLFFDVLENQRLAVHVVNRNIKESLELRVVLEK